MKRIWMAVFLVALAFATDAVPAARNGEGGMAGMKSRPDLREQMDKMILSMFDVDIMMNKTRQLDYEVLRDDAERILQAIGEIRAKDKHGVFYKHLKRLEDPTRQMLRFSKKQDPAVSKYADEMFDACFQCHSIYRKNPLY